MAKAPKATSVDEGFRSGAMPWTELDPQDDRSGLREGEEAVFRTAAERDAFFRGAIYGQRFNTGIYLKPQREFNAMMFVKAGLAGKGRVLLIGEALEPMGLVPLGRSVLGPGVEIVPLEMRHLALAHKAGRWPVYREVSAPYREGEFDAVIAAQWHHCDDLLPEFRALARLVRPGGKLVLVDNGPAASTFEMAKQDVLLDYLLRQFVTWAGSRHVAPGEAFDYQKATWLKVSVEEVFDAARRVLGNARLWEYKGMAMIDGVRKV
jgi:SAM-dependent methyltransferase